MGSFPGTFNDPKRKDETNANKYYKCMRSDVFEKSTKFHTGNVFAWPLYGVLPGLLGQFTWLTYPRRNGKRLTSSLEPRDPKSSGLRTKGPTI